MAKESDSDYEENAKPTKREKLQVSLGGGRQTTDPKRDQPTGNTKEHHIHESSRLRGKVTNAFVRDGKLVNVVSD
jgi:hypothetical protein